VLKWQRYYARALLLLHCSFVSCCQFHHVGLGFAHAYNGSPMFKIVTMRHMDWVMKNVNVISRVGYCLKKWNRFWCIWKKSLQSGKYLTKSWSHVLMISPWSWQKLVTWHPYEATKANLMTIQKSPDSP